MDLTQPGGKDLLFGQVEAIFARLDPETWAKAPRMKNYLRKATLLVLAGERHPTIAHVKQALLDAALGKDAAPELREAAWGRSIDHRVAVVHALPQLIERITEQSLPQLLQALPAASEWEGVRTAAEQLVATKEAAQRRDPQVQWASLPDDARWLRSTRQRQEVLREYGRHVDAGGDNRLLPQQLLRLLADHAEGQHRAIESASRATALSESRYLNGLVSQRDLLDAKPAV